MPKDFAIAANDLNGEPDGFPAISLVDRVLNPGILVRLFDAQAINNDHDEVMFHQVLISSAEAVALANALLVAASANEDRHAEAVVPRGWTDDRSR